MAIRSIKQAHRGQAGGRRGWCAMLIGVAALQPPRPSAAAAQPVHPAVDRAPGGPPRGSSAPAAQLGLSALSIGLLFGVVLVAPLPLWAGQPVGPPGADAVPAGAVG